MFKNPSDSKIREILKGSKNIAVVGLSENKERDSYRVAQYLREKGYNVIPVNPTAREIMGLKSYPDLSSVPEKVDIVNVFRRSEHLPAVVEEALRVKPGCIWAQLGVFDDRAAARAAGEGVPVIMDRCIKIEHERLL
ncbi:MAG: CoA-binding protein [Peptococcaceae bacterium]|nr:CoA-binding protein [Peptococcaceae bacterium]